MIKEIYGDYYIVSLISADDFYKATTFVYKIQLAVVAWLDAKAKCLAYVFCDAA